MTQNDNHAVVAVVVIVVFEIHKTCAKRIKVYEVEIK